MKSRRTVLGLLLAVIAVGSQACGGGGGARPASTNDGATLPAARLSLVAYSTPQAAYDQITEAFRKTPEGRNISFTKSYGGSGDQSRAVESGLAADVVAFSLEPDMTRLVKAGIVDAGWDSDAHKGMVTDSVVVLVTRKGNPKNIRTWSDLTRPGIQVITPNPFASGGARWNVMAAYGQAIEAGKSEEEAVQYLNDLFKHVPVQDSSARASLQTFTSGKGDVMIAYENEAIFAQQKGQPIDYVVPDQTIQIENPVAVTKTTQYPQQAQAFLDFLHGATGQEIFAKNGYRPVTADVKSPYKFPQPAGLFTIAKFGTWADVSKKFFDTTTGVMADIERRIGVSVG